MSRISLVIPCHNDEAYLGEALQSVFDQTRPPDEVIVVDDGSTDSSARVAAGFGDRVRLIRQENQGISGARNTGAGAALGDMITFLDADDLWTRDSLAVRLARLEEDLSIDCVFGLSEQFLSPDLPEDLRQRLYCPPGAAAARFAGAMLIRKAAYDRVGGFTPGLKVGETMDWVARLIDTGAKIETVEALVMRRRIHGDNTVIREKPSHGDYLRVLKAALDRKTAAAGAGS